MGYALAREFLRRGAKVTLITGPVTLSPPRCRIIKVISAKDMLQAVRKQAPRADMILMAAAVSDYRPAKRSLRKLKKTGQAEHMKLVPTTDILKELGQRKKKGQRLVGFAAETDHVERNALKKLKSKNLDGIIANPVGRKESGFESDQNKAIVFTASGQKKSFPQMTKIRLAKHLVTFLGI